MSPRRQRGYRGRFSLPVSTAVHINYLVILLTGCTASAHAPALFELKPQLLDRYHRLRELIAFIRQNKLLHLVSQRLPVWTWLLIKIVRYRNPAVGSCPPMRRKQKLLSSCGSIRIATWREFHFLHTPVFAHEVSQSQSRSPQSLLADGIAMYIEKQGLSGQEDVVRYFFRTQVRDTCISPGVH
jgi:hypothetical protein